MASQFLPISNNYVGSAAPQGTVYPTVWNQYLQRFESDDPNYVGWSRSGVWKGPKPSTVPAPITVAGVPSVGVGAPTQQPATGLPPIFNGMNLAAPANQQFVDRAVVASPISAGASQVFPLNVPQGPGVSTITVPKSGAVSAATSPMFSELNTLKEDVNKTLAEFKAKYPSWLAGQEKTAAEENAATSGIYNGAEQGKINALLADYTTKANAANAKSIADTQRLRSRSLISTGGGASSAVDRGQFATIADINAKAAAQASDRALTANQWLTQLQQAMAGAQAARGRAAIGDTLLPATVETQSFENILRQLVGLSGVEQNNLLTGIVGPNGMVGDTFGQLQGLTIQDLQRMQSVNQAADTSAFNWAQFNRQPQMLASQERTSANNAAAARTNFYNSMLTPTTQTRQSFGGM